MQEKFTENFLGLSPPFFCEKIFCLPPWKGTHQALNTIMFCIFYFILLKILCIKSMSSFCLSSISGPQEQLSSPFFFSLQVLCKSSRGKNLICGATVAFWYHRFASNILDTSNIAKEQQEPWLISHKYKFPLSLCFILLLQQSFKKGSHIQLHNDLAVGALGDRGVNGMIRQYRKKIEGNTKKIMGNLMNLTANLEKTDVFTL